jgi:uncharacterized protein DUF1566
MMQYGRMAALVLGVILGLGISASPTEARKPPCSPKRCKAAIKARCVGLKGKAKRMCKRGIISSCKAGQCSCTDGVPSCAEPPTTTSTSTTSTTTTSTSTTTLMSGACLRDIGDGTIQDICTGLQWEKKVSDPGLQNVDTLYSWAGCCDIACTILCQPNAAAAATCAANSDGGVEGCSTCVSGTCNVDVDASGVPTTVWDWINQVNAASFAGHSDWRLPSEAGNNVVSEAKEMETIVDLAATGCGFGSPCIDPIFGPTIADNYFSASTVTSSASMAWSVGFGAGNAASGSKQFGFYIRAVR